MNCATLRGADGAVGAHIGADVHVSMPAQTQDGAVAAAGDLDVAFRLARVVHAHEVLAAVLGPFHGAAGVTGRERDQEILRVELAARAEAAADVVLHQLDRAFRQPHLLRQGAAVEEQHLGAAADREPPARGVPLGEQAARLHRQRHVPRGAEALAPGVGRVLERGGGVAAHGAEGDRLVGALVREQQRVVARRRVAVGDRRQRLDVDLDQAERILGDAGAVGEHHRDWLRRHSAPCVSAITGCPNGSKSGSGCSRIGTRGTRLPISLAVMHAMHAGERARGGDVDRAEAAVGDGAAQDRGVQHVLAHDDRRHIARARAGSADPPGARSGCR